MTDQKSRIVKNFEDIPERRGTIYPAPFKEGFDGRVKRSLTSALGLSQFGVNIVILEPQCLTSHRHWHKTEDEFVYVLEGEVTLEDNSGETTLTPGMCVGFPAGEPNGHRIINKTDKPARILEVGTRNEVDQVEYPDIDLKAVKDSNGFAFFHKDGTPYK